MKKLGFKDFLVLAAVFGVAIGVTGVVVSRAVDTSRKAPKTIFDVALAARERGLSARSDTVDGRIDYVLVVSRTPLKWEQVREGGLAVRRYPGVVYAREQQPGVHNRADEADVYWGEVALFGDRALIEELVKGR